MAVIDHLANEGDVSVFTLRATSLKGAAENEFAIVARTTEDPHRFNQAFIVQNNILTELQPFAITDSQVRQDGISFPFYSDIPQRSLNS